MARLANASIYHHFVLTVEASSESKIEALLGPDHCGIKIQRDILHFDSSIRTDRTATREIVSEHEGTTKLLQSH